MKKTTLILITIFMSIGLISQTPQAFKYQAVVRDNLGEIIANQEVKFRISIRDVSASGTVLYQEIHDVTTNEFGLVNLVIGDGDPPITGFIEDIDWGTNEKFMEVELDPDGNTAYVSMGTTQLLAVPYSLYAESTGDTSRWRRNIDDLYYLNGRVGIGTSTPQVQLDVKSSAEEIGTSIYLNNLNETHWLQLFGGRGGVSPLDPALYWQEGQAFRFASFGTQENELMRISEVGNVGIGTTSPNELLEVAGTVYSTTGGFKFPDGSMQSTSASAGAINNTLDQAYDQGGPGAGRVINADNGAVNIQGSGGLTVTGNIGVNNTSPTFPLSIQPGTNTRGIYIDHNQSGVGLTQAIYVEVDKTYAETSNVLGGEFQITNNNGSGTTYGLWGYADGTSTGLKFGVRGDAIGANVQYGVYGFASGSGTQYGVYGAATGSGDLWAGYFGGGNVYIDNRLGIGTESPDAELHVIGKVHITDRLGIGTLNPLSTLSVGGDGIVSAAISGQTNDLTGKGIRGVATNSGTTINYGGYFLSYGETGRGVYAQAANNGDVMNYGGRFFAAGQNGIGVYGEATSTVQGSTNFNYGGYFSASGPLGRGVYGIGYYGVYASGNVGVYGRGTWTGVYGYVTEGSGEAIYGYIGSSTGDYAGYFHGNVECTGGYTKSFSINKIDHPLDPENQYLYHSSVESSEMMNVYNGNIILDSNGEAWVTLPDWFEALNKEFRYQLTCIGGFAQVFILQEVQNNQFKIAGGIEGMKVSWQVTGIRKDKLAEQFPIAVEKEKPGKERGKYLHPEAFGLDESRGIGYEETKLMNSRENDSIIQNEEDLQ